MKIEESIKILKRGVVDFINEDELIKKLQKNQPLKIKLGADPSAPDIHLGHVVVLKKLKQFQELGHQIIFLIGDFTGMIGDPTGKSKTRIALTREKVLENAQTYKKQIFKILDKEKTKIIFNSEWSSLLTFSDVLELTSKYTLARLLEREDFSTRYLSKQPITITELLYPLIQGFDSVKLQADVELGGTDQLFNLLVGRELQKSYNQEPQVVITMPLLEGLDGKKKMSKSLGNYIGINDSAKDMFGKTMSIPDNLIIPYFSLVTEVPLQKIEEIKEKLEQGDNPRNYKIILAKEIVKEFHSDTEAENCHQEFLRIFSKGGLPDKIPEIILSSKDLETISLLNLIKKTQLLKSNSEIRRMIESGGVKINDKKIEDFNYMGKIKNKDLLKVGKRNFYKIIIKERKNI